MYIQIIIRHLLFRPIATEFYKKQNIKGWSKMLENVQKSGIALFSSYKTKHPKENLQRSIAYF